MQDDIERYSRVYRGFRLIRQTAYSSPPTAEPDTPSESTSPQATSTTSWPVQLRTPSPEAVARIIRLATEANDDGFAEPHWDCRVHTRVLEMALEHDTFMDRVDFLNWYVG